MLKNSIGPGQEALSVLFDELCQSLSALPQVEVIALGGSRAGDCCDQQSDYDLYLYCDSVPSESERCQILQRYCTRMEIGNAFWELEDDCVLQDGIPIDILYRNLDDFTRDVASVVENHFARNGYSTCMWHNLLHSKIIYDRDGRFSALQSRFDVPYPEELRQNIIHRNIRLLTGNLPSYDAQIQKAVLRKDYPSINHRMAAFLESYFDILFALNRLTHPGEKRMISYLMVQATILPKDFTQTLEQAFACMYTTPERLPEVIAELDHNLLDILPL